MLNQYSLKKIDQLNAELPIRLELIKRCGGKPLPYNETAHHNGTAFIIRRVRCLGGMCECGHRDCRKFAGRINGELEPHEKVPRGRGGKLSLDNTIMVLHACHIREQNREPKLNWIRGIL